MDWRYVTLAAIIAVVAVGFAWYERSRPGSRIVALVAALTALAVAGRLVLAPVPNAVGTTDIALLTGYALGGPPGFAVGALAAPISNIWLGQGPWTLWQMAGWGLAGMAGAGLALAAGRHLGRMWLAVACAAVGLLYGALLDLSVMVTYGGEQSLDRYLALSARGIPFNVAHAAGNFAIAFVAGPALVRMIGRYRERLSFTWHPAGALPALLVALAVATLIVPAESARADAGRARGYLIKHQNADGGFAPSPGSPSSPRMTNWTMLGLEAAGTNPLDVGRRSPVAYLRANAGRITSATDLELTILSLDGAGIESSAFAGRNLPAELLSKRRGDGSWEGQVNITAFGILGLRAAGQGDVDRSAAWLRDAQNASGGWGFAPGRASDADSTGAAMQALAAAGGSSNALAAATRYLAGSQRGDGGWTLAGGVTNSQSTAWAVQGLVAAGRSGGPVRDGIAYLAKRQQSDGHYRYSSSREQTPIWVTGQALLAVTRSPFPLAAVARAADGGGGGGGSGGSPASAQAGSIAGPGDSGSGRRGGKGDDGGGAAKSRSRSPGSGEPAARSGEGYRLDFDLDEGGDATATGEPASSSPMRDPAKVGAGLGGLALALGGGFLWYRRTLP